jgi:hypothetical protein
MVVQWVFHYRTKVPWLTPGVITPSRKGGDSDLRIGNVIAGTAYKSHSAQKKPKRFGNGGTLMEHNPSYLRSSVFISGQ